MVRQRARTSGEFAMNAIQTEMLYIQRRLAATRAMADAAAGPCARAAHETLARLYAARLTRCCGAVPDHRAAGRDPAARGLAGPGTGIATGRAAAPIDAEARLLI
jgi:hypothetical protein